MNITNELGWIGILSFCFGIYRICNGRLTAVIDKINEKVHRGECHQAQDSIKNSVDKLEEHIDKRFDSLGKEIERLYNGKKG